VTLPIIHEVDDYDLDRFVRVAAEFGSQHYGFVVTPNVDHIIRWCEDPAFRTIYAQAAYVLMDSRFLAALLRITKGVRLPVCTGSDLTARILSEVARPDDRVVLIGARADQAKRLADLYGLKGIRHFDPPMGFIDSPVAVEACLDFIESNSPFRFCFLAVGAPRQEMLAAMLKQRARSRGLALCIGASIDFLTGHERRAPKWMQRSGLEWAYRLAQNPGRLASRYLLRGPRVFGLLRRLDFQLRPVGNKRI
jgi:exopolysaccharide biosynthesis WecB/TagA/CpsF family protein